MEAEQAAADADARRTRSPTSSAGPTSAAGPKGREGVVLDDPPLDLAQRRLLAALQRLGRACERHARCPSARCRSAAALSAADAGFAAVGHDYRLAAAAGPERTRDRSRSRRAGSAGPLARSRYHVDESRVSVSPAASQSRCEHRVGDLHPLYRDGVRTPLARAAAIRTAAGRLDRIVATTLWENLPARSLLARPGFRSTGSAGAEIEYELTPVMTKTFEVRATFPAKRVFLPAT